MAFMGVGRLVNDCCQFCSKNLLIQSVISSSAEILGVLRNCYWRFVLVRDFWEVTVHCFKEEQWIQNFRMT